MFTFLLETDVVPELVEGEESVWTVPAPRD